MSYYNNIDEGLLNAAASNAFKRSEFNIFMCTGLAMARLVRPDTGRAVLLTQENNGFATYQELCTSLVMIC